MGFQVVHEIVAGTVLIIEAVQSQNYVAGVSGWIVTADGMAEFSDATIRGTLIAGGGVVEVNDQGIYIDGTNGQAISLTRDFALIVTSALFGEIQVDTFSPGAGGKPFIQWTTPDSTIASPVVKNKATWEAGLLDDIPNDRTRPYIQLQSPGVDGQGQCEMFLYGNRSDGDPQYIQVDATGGLRSGSTLHAGPNDGDVGRGQVTKVSAAANSAAIPNGFTTVMTTAAIDWEPNRAYEIKLGGRYSTSVANMAPDTAVISSALTTMAQMGRVACTTTNPFGIPYGQNVFTTGAAVLNRSLSWRLSSGTAGQTVTINGPRWLAVYDIGPATDYPDAVVLV